MLDLLRRERLMPSQYPRALWCSMWSLLSTFAEPSGALRFRNRDSVAKGCAWRMMQGWGENDRGVSYTFGPDSVTEFLAKHDLDLICRAHQVPSNPCRLSW